MLGNVAANQPLTEGQLQSIEYMYSTNLALKRSFNELTSTATADDIMRALNGKSGVISSTFDNIESNVIQTPKEIHDGPFSESIEKVSAKNLDDLKEISAPEAQELATKYFSEYHVSEAKCTGETLAKELVCYNVALTTEDGDMMAQISKKGGKVVLFDSYKDCSDKNFSTERCITIATDFLETLGYTDMKAVWASENGTTCNLNFAYTVNDTVVYPDIIKVKVCEQRGIVTGIEALSYVLNHTQRSIESPALSLEEAQKNVDKKVEIKGSRLTIIPYHGEEALAYEFYGSVDKNDYYVYIDAATGKEIKIFTVVGTAQGRALL
jgi:germination protein YpeB